MSFSLAPTLLEHLNASLQVIEIGTSAHYRGAEHAYRPVATELRKLLCDTQSGRDNSLVLRCFPQTHLHVVAGGAAMIDELTTLYIPGRISTGGAARVELDFMFDEAGPMLPLAQWTEQPLLNNRATVRSLIRSVADKESAHADASPNDTLLLGRSVFLGAHDTLASKAIITIARYIAKGIVIRYLVATGQAKAALNRGNGRRGMLRLSVGATCRHGIQAIPLEFADSSALDEVQAFNAEDRERARQFIAAYDPEREYILLVVDLNERQHSLYKIGL
jgi:hypothetical protein